MTRLPTGLVAAVAAFVTAFALLSLAAASHEPRVPEHAAVRAALENDLVEEFVERWGYDRVRIVALDRELTRVTLFRRQRIVANVAVKPDGAVRGFRLFRPRGPMLGSALAEGLPLVALLTTIAALMLVTTPLRSVRNLDALALLAFAVPIVAGYHRLFELSVYSLYPPLAWLCGRCVWRAFRDLPPQEVRPSLYERATARLDRGAARRILAMVGMTATVIVAGVGVTAPGAIDVGFASVQGATRMLTGQVPYANLVDVIHGDTYPILNYAAYIPGALLLPVRDSFDDPAGALVVATLAALLVALALLRIAGSRMAIAWLCLPPVLVAASGGSNDLVLAACIALALAAVATRPGLASAALAAGAWVKLAPLAVFPAWLAALRRGDRRRALGALAVTTALALVWLVTLGGTRAIGEMVTALAFQLERGTLQSLWGLTDARLLQRLAMAGVAVLMLLLVLRGRRRPELARDPAWLAAACGAVLLALQLVSTNMAVTYATWAAPCVLVGLLAGPCRSRPQRKEKDTAASIAARLMALMGRRPEVRAERALGAR